MLKRRLCFGAFWALVLSFSTLAMGAELFVNKQGNDANNGASQANAFLTIQKGVNALNPGDTLNIGSGEYFESVESENLGGPDVDTVIRAEIPGTVVMRGDVPAPSFEKVEGYQFVYAAPFDGAPQALLEHDTLRILKKRPNILGVEYEPGTYYYDEAGKKLYMSSSDLRPPTGRYYTVAVGQRHGINLKGPQRVVIDGLSQVGFYPGWGVVLNPGTSCTVRNGAMYLCEGGVCLEARGSGNVIENCDSYAHTFGGIVLYRCNNDIIRNCRTYLTQGTVDDEYFGVMHYHSMAGPLLIQNNISWGQRFDYSVKPAQSERLENCIALGTVRNANMFHNIIGGGNEYDRDSLKAAPDNILFLREEDLDRDAEFADPLNMDFRLQPESRFRGTAPDGSDRGPYPYEANIFYVSPDGDDAADGLSIRNPWRTLSRAFRDIRPGTTLYLCEGEYESAPLRDVGDGKTTISIRGRGYGTAVVLGTLSVRGCAGIAFERLNFSDGVSLNVCSDAAFENCTFFGEGDGVSAVEVQGLQVRHSVFKEVPVRLAQVTNTMLTENIYANAGRSAVILDADDAIHYSDYNSYQDTAQSWQVGGATWSFADLQKRHDPYSRTVVPEFVMENGAPRIGNAESFDGRGRGSRALGPYRDYDGIPKPLRLSGPFLHSVSDTTANIEWWLSKPATFDLAWGDTPEMTNKVKNLNAPDCFTTYSLTGLEPGKKYYFSIQRADTTGKSEAVFATVLEPVLEPLSFTTLAERPEAKEYYVSTDGNDANTGLNRENAWRTVSHAADMANAGDTVLIAGGDYAEGVHIRATGDEGRPITFKCVPGEKVVFHGDGLVQAFKVVSKKNVRFDGFYFDTFKDAEAPFVLWDADDVQITRCFSFKGNGYGNFVVGAYCANLLIKNCVVSGGMSQIELYVSPNFHVENNLLLRPLIGVLNFVNKPDQKGFFRKNVVTDNLPSKVRAALLTVGRIESLVEEDNCYWLRRPEPQRNIFQFYGTAAYGRYDRFGITTDFTEPPVIEDNPDGTENNPNMPLSQYQAMVGDTGSYAGDPEFAILVEAVTKWFEPYMIANKNLDFLDIFATNPKAVEKGIGPQPEAFKDFWFNKDK